MAHAPAAGSEPASQTAHGSYRTSGLCTPTDPSLESQPCNLRLSAGSGRLADAWQAAPMKIGTSLRSTYPVADSREGAQCMVERAAAAAAAGLDSLFVGDHHATGPTAYYQNS